MKNKVIRVKYGREYLEARIPCSNYHELTVKGSIDEHPMTEEEHLFNALSNPTDSPKLHEIIKKDNRIAVVTSDITRPFPSGKILPLVIREILRCGAVIENIIIVFAMGSHRRHTDNDFRTLLGELYDSGIKYMDSDPDDCINYGRTKRGTPIDIFRPVSESDTIICLGNIEYHYFAGFSGGYKALMPGVSSIEAISVNHSFMMDERSISGNISDNQVRADIDEVSDYIQMDFLINVILDSDKRVIGAVAGDGIKAHRSGCLLYQKHNDHSVSDKVDIIVAGEGHPKDMNFYQAQKYLESATDYIRTGGVIIWCAKAEEGFGNEIFEQWILNKTKDEITNDLKSGFVLGGHKAGYIAKILNKYTIITVTDQTDQTVIDMGMIPAATLQDAVNKAIELKGVEAKLAVISKI